MAKKKASSKTKKAATKKTRRSTRTRVRAEFLILRIGNPVKPGDSVKIVGVASSLEGARKKVDALSSPAPLRVAIVEKQVVLERRPKVIVASVEENITAD